MAPHLEPLIPIYRLWWNDKLMLSEVDNLSILDVERANQALDAWEAAVPDGGKK